MRIPAGFALVAVGEVYIGNGEIVVLGKPPNEEHLPEDERHNCDAMGCGSVGPHVVFRDAFPWAAVRKGGE